MKPPTLKEYAAQESEKILNGERLLAPEQVMERLTITRKQLQALHRGVHPRGLFLPAATGWPMCCSWSGNPCTGAGKEGGMAERLILLLLLLALLGAVPTLRQRHQRWSKFQRRAQAKGLRPAQRRLLWELARQQQRNPVLLLRSASAFELCLGEYVRGEGKGSTLAELGRIRVLLGFSHHPAAQSLHNTRQLAQGHTLNLWPATEDTSRSAQCLVIAASEPALVLTPLSGTTPAWPTGTNLRACFQPGPHHQYHFTTQLLERTTHTLNLEHTGQLQPLQMREFLRWDTAFPLTLLIPGRRGKGQPVEGQVANISGGGLRVQVQEKVPAGTPVVVDPQHQGPFPLAGVKGRVVAGSRTRGRALHIQFVSLPRQTEARIVRRIYQHQTGRRLRGESGYVMSQKRE